MLVQQPSDAGRIVVRCCANDGSMLYNSRSRLFHTRALAASEVCSLSRGYATSSLSDGVAVLPLSKIEKTFFYFSFFLFLFFFLLPFLCQEKGVWGKNHLSFPFLSLNRARSDARRTPLLALFCAKTTPTFGTFLSHPSPNSLIFAQIQKSA